MKPTCLGMPPSLAVFSTAVSHSPVVSRRYLVKPCNKSWDDGIVALEAGALCPLHSRTADMDSIRPKGPGTVR